MLRRLLPLMVGAFAFGLAATAAVAAPSGAPLGAVKADVAQTSTVEKVWHRHHGRCHWHRGHWLCPRHYHRHHYYHGGYYYRPWSGFYWGWGRPWRRHYGWW